jgi:hypothetical protein
MTNRYALPAAIALALSFATLAAAQGGPGGQGPQGGPGGFMLGGPGFMSGGGPGGINPLQANPMGLLQRPEVQNELHLDLNQKNAIAALQTETRNGLRQKMQQAMQGSSPKEMRSMTPQQRRQRMQELQPQIQAAIQSSQGDLDSKVKAILKPDQITRLYQLDKQRRGPLSMADGKVAEEVKLTPEHRQAIQQIFQEYQQQQRDLMNQAFESTRQNADTRNGQPPPFPDFSSKLSPWKQKMDKIRRASEDAALATLDSDEKAGWKAATGEPFTFRADPPPQPNRFGPGGPGGRSGGFGPGGGPGAAPAGPGGPPPTAN